MVAHEVLPRLAWLRHLNIPLALLGLLAFRPDDAGTYLVITALLTLEWPLFIQLAEGVEVYLPVTWTGAAAAFVLGPMVLPVVFVSATLGFFLIVVLDRAQLIEAKGLAAESLRRLRAEPHAPGTYVDGMLRQFVYMSAHGVRVALAWALPPAWGFFGRAAFAECVAQAWIRVVPIAGRFVEAEVRERFVAALGREALVATGLLHLAVVGALLLAYQTGGLPAFVAASIATIPVHRILHALNQARLESERRRQALVAMREELDRRQRLAAIGQTASIVFHQIGRQHGVIGMFAHLLAREPGPVDAAGPAGWQERVRGYARKILGSVDEANHVIDELLRFAEDHALNLYAHSVATLAEECRAGCVARAARAGVAIRVGASGDALVPLDKHKLRQALGNLLDNAIDASPRGGVVDLEVAVAPAAVHFSVRDRGSGVAPEVRERLFAPFCTTKPGGIGLGLVLAREIIEAHGGRIEWVPADPGTIFDVTVPRARD